jgi:ATP-dependent DNA ligase
MLGGFRGDSVSAQIPYVPAMFKSFEFCIPTKSTTVPDGPDWLHEVKYDGYRLLLERDGDRVRLITRAVTIGASAFDGLWRPR